MVFNLYNGSLTRLAQIDTFVSCLWTERYNTLGMFSLELEANPRFNQLFQPDYYISLDERECVMVIKSVVFENNKIKISGFPATRMLDDRAFADTVSNENVESFLLDLIDGLDYTVLKAGLSKGYTDMFTRQTSNKSVMQICEILCQEVDMGFKIVKDGTYLRFVCYKPPYAYHPFRSAYGNLGDKKIVYSNESLKNVAIVMGQGTGAERVTVTVGDTSLTDTARKEMIIDARQIQQEEEETAEHYQARLEAQGWDKLAKQIETKQVQVDVATTLDLGDIATCYIDDFDFTVIARIMAYTIKAQNNVKTITIQIGDPIIMRE